MDSFTSGTWESWTGHISVRLQAAFSPAYKCQNIPTLAAEQFLYCLNRQFDPPDRVKHRLSKLYSLPFDGVFPETLVQSNAPSWCKTRNQLIVPRRRLPRVRHALQQPSHFLYITYPNGNTINKIHDYGYGCIRY